MVKAAEKTPQSALGKTGAVISKHKKKALALAAFLEILIQIISGKSSVEHGHEYYKEITNKSKSEIQVESESRRDSARNIHTQDKALPVLRFKRIQPEEYEYNAELDEWHLALPQIVPVNEDDSILPPGFIIPEEELKKSEPPPDFHLPPGVIYDPSNDLDKENK